jgi:hypothetical protein
VVASIAPDVAAFGLDAVTQKLDCGEWVVLPAADSVMGLWAAGINGEVEPAAWGSSLLLVV